MGEYGHGKSLFPKEIVIVIIVAIAIAGAAMMFGQNLLSAINSGGNTNPATNPSPVEVPKTGGDQLPVVNITTPAPTGIGTTTPMATKEEKSNLNLLKKIGPIEFPPYTGSGAIEANKEDFEIEGVRFVVGGDSFKKASVKRIGWTWNGEKGSLIVIMLIRDKEGNPCSICGWDNETRGYYFSKTTVYKNIQLQTKVEYAVPPIGTNAQIALGENLYTWEVYVYG